MLSSLQSEQSARRGLSVPVNYFAVALGTGALGAAWRTGASKGMAPDWVGESILAFNAVVWLLLVGFLIHSVVKYRAWVRSFWEHPARTCFFSLIPATTAQVGEVFQRPILYPHLSVKDNILFPIRLGAFSGGVDMDYYRELLEALKLEGLESRKPSQLSGGQAQRVGIARALIRRAPVVLFDEPLASVDEQMSASIRADIVRLHERYGFTGLYVTHDQNEALMLGQRVAVMDAGYLVQVDTPERLLAHPHTLQVAKLMAAPALNLLALEDSEALPAGCELAIRATALCPVAADAAHGLPVQVLGCRHLVGGMLYRGRLLEAVSLPLKSPRAQTETELSAHLKSPRAQTETELSAQMYARVRAGQELEFFIPDAQGATLSGTSPNSTFLSVGERVHLGVAAERCFLFSGGKRFYL